MYILDFSYFAVFRDNIETFQEGGDVECVGINDKQFIYNHINNIRTNFT